MDGKRSKNTKRLGRILGDRKSMWGQKMLSLAGLACNTSKESIEILEKYLKNIDPEMKVYAKLALIEAKALRLARA